MADQLPNSGGRYSDLGPDVTGSNEDDDQSLGIIDVDNMPDLSGSFFGLDTGQDAHHGPPPSLGGQGNWANQSWGQNLGARPKQRPVALFDVPLSEQPVDALNEDNSETFDEVPMELINAKHFGEADESQSHFDVPPQSYTEAPIEKISGLHAMPQLTGMFAGGFTEDGDTSIHEICFGENELDQFDEEFSDLGDSDEVHSDDTIIDDSPEAAVVSCGVAMNMIDIAMPAAPAKSPTVDLTEADDNGMDAHKSDDLQYPEKKLDFISDKYSDGDEIDTKSQKIELHNQNSDGKHDQGSENSVAVPESSIMPNRLESLYFRPGSAHGNCSDEPEISEPTNKIFDYGCMGQPARGSNIFGDTKLSLGTGNETSPSNIFGNFGGSNLSLGMPGDTARVRQTVGNLSLGMPGDTARVRQTDGNAERSVQLSDSAYDVTETDDNMFLGKMLSIPKPTIDEKSPVYITENGVGVTDLAYRTSFKNLTDMTRNTFGEELFGEEVLGIDESEFVPAGDMLEQLALDEEKFAEENIFRPDAVMSNQSMPSENWGIHSNPFSHPPTPDPMASYMRISIGQFMGARTEVLGALDGKTDVRPHFGRKIITPPGNRTPVALLDKTSPNDATQQNLRISSVPEEIRGSGVGSDVDLPGFDPGDGEDDVKSSPPLRDCTLTTDDLTGLPDKPTSPTSTTPVMSMNHLDKDELATTRRGRSFSPDGSSSGQSQLRKVRSLGTKVEPKKTSVKKCEINEKSNMDQEAEDGSKKDLLGVDSDLQSNFSALNNSTPVVNLSTIENIITSSNGKPEEVVNYVLRMSQAKSKGKVRHTSRDRRKAALEAKRTSLESSDPDEVDNKYTAKYDGKSLCAGGKSTDSVRRPADGKSAPHTGGVAGLCASSSVPHNTDTHGTSSQDSGDDGPAQRLDLLGQSQDRCGSSSSVKKKTNPPRSKHTVTGKNRVSGINTVSVLGRRRGSDNSTDSVESASNPRRGSITADKRSSLSRRLTDQKPDTSNSAPSTTDQRKAPTSIIRPGTSQSRGSASSAGSQGSDKKRESTNNSDKRLSSRGSVHGLGEKKISGSSLVEGGRGSKIPIMRRSSLEEVNAGGRKSTLEDSSKSQVAKANGAMQGTNPSNIEKQQIMGAKVEEQPIADLMRKLGISSTAEIKSNNKQEDVDGCASDEEKFDYEISDSHLPQNPKWKSPRPSSVLCRSQRGGRETEHQKPVLNAVEANNCTTLVEDDDTPVRKRSTAPRRVKFQQTKASVSAERELSEAASGSDPDLHTPDNTQSEEVSAKKKWMSSTPKVPQDQIDMCQEGISNIIVSPQDSFLQTYTEPSLWQDRTQSQPPADKQQAKSVAMKSRVDDFIQNSGSYRPGKPQLNTMPLSDRTQTHSEPSLLASQYLDSQLHMNNGTKRSQSIQGGPRIQYDGVFKVPPPPALPFEDRPSLPFGASSGPVHEHMFRTSLSPQQEMDESLSSSRLSNNRESVPGLPANHSTPFNNSSRNSLEPKSPPSMNQAKTGGTRSLQPTNGKNIRSSLTATWAGGFVQSYSMEAPNDVRIPGVCCVGLSTQGSIPLTNTSRCWLQVKAKVASLSMDGVDQDVTRCVPFVYKEMAMLEPDQSQNFRIVFVPHQAGAYVAELHYTVCPLTDQTSQAVNNKPTIVTLQAMAERPMVQIKSDTSRNMLDFGALPWGRQKGMFITMTNKGRSNIPVRLVISNHSAWNCFMFDKNTHADVSVVSSQNRPDIPSLLPTICNLILPGVDDGDNENPIQNMIYFNAPDRQMNRALLSLPPQYLQATLSVEVDMPSAAISLGSLSLLAAVGTARLHTPVDLEFISMKTHLGRSAMQRVPLRNAGNIPLEVSLEVTHWPDFFTVIPMQLMIEPGGQSEFLVKFEPKQSTMTEFESLLLMFVEPDGPGFEIALHSVTVPQPIVSPYTRPLHHAAQLLSNKRYLAWGGVPIGQSSVQTLTLKNAADHMMKVMLEIQNNDVEFKILSSYGHKKKLSMTKEIMLKPQEEFPVHICFKPSAVAGAQARLQIKKINSTFRCGIGLSGYGGVSELALECVKSDSLAYSWVSIGYPTAGNKLVTQVKVRNQGKRPAYVRAIGFHDLGGKRRIDCDRKLIVQPQEFCVDQDKAVDVLIHFMPSETDTSMCAGQAAILAVVGFIYGDELSHQLYKLALRKNPDSVKQVQLPDTHFMKDINFDVPYLNDRAICTENDVKSTASDLELFFSSMRRTMLALVGKPPPKDTVIVVPNAKQKEQVSSIPCVATWESGKSANVGRSYDQNKPSNSCRLMALNSPPVRDTTNPEPTVNGKQPSTQESMMAVISTNDTQDVKRWTLQPKQLILTAPHKDETPEIKKLQITNFTDRIMRFELLWPGHYITVTPEEGNVPPMSFMSVCLSACPDLAQRTTQLPWSGSIHVTCNGETKVLKVQVHNDTFSEEILPSASMPDTPTAQTFFNQPATPLIAIATPSTNRSSEHLRVTNQKLEFVSTKVRERTEQYAEVINICSCPIRWSVTSFAPPYLKPAEAVSEVFRVTYSVFRLPKITGLLDPHQSVQLPVYFTPRERGHYSQFWEISCEIIDGTSSHIGANYTCKLELQGQCINNDATGEKNIVTRRVIPVTSLQPPSSTKVKSSCGILTLEPETLHFTVQTPGMCQTKKLRIGNKSKINQEVEVIMPDYPFRIGVKVTQMVIRSRHVLSLPIQFFPKTPGYFQSVLIFKMNSGEIITSKLSGVCENH